MMYDRIVRAFGTGEARGGGVVFHLPSVKFDPDNPEH